jgi:hypothetical protein
MEITHLVRYIYLMRLRYILNLKQLSGQIKLNLLWVLVSSDSRTGGNRGLVNSGRHSEVSAILLQVKFSSLLVSFSDGSYQC